MNAEIINRKNAWHRETKNVGRGNNEITQSDLVSQGFMKEVRNTPLL